MNSSLNQGNQLNQERNTLIQNNNIEQKNLNNVSNISNEESNNRIDFMNDIYDLKNSAKNIHESGLEKQEKLTNTLNTRLNQIHTDLYVSSDDLVALDSKLNQISNKDKILTANVNIEDNSIVSNIKKMFNIPIKIKVINFEAKFYKTKYGYLLLYESPDSEPYKALYDNYFKKNKSLRIGSSICVAPFPFTNYKDKWVPLPLGLENTFVFPELDTDIKPSSNLFVYNDNINLKKPKQEEPLNYDTIEYSMNQDIQALYKDTGRWYPGNISKINKNGTYEIKWLDDDDEDRSKNNKSLRPGFYINQKVKAEIKRNIWKEGIIQKILLSGKYTVKINDTNKNVNFKYESLKAIDKFKIIRDDPIEEPIETIVTKQGPTDEEILANRRKNFIELKSDKIEKINLKQYDTVNNSKFKEVPDDIAVNTLFKQLVEDNKEGFINSSGVQQEPSGCVNQYKKIYDCETFEQDYINNETDLNSIIDEENKIEQHIYGHVPGGTNNGQCFNGFTKSEVETILTVVLGYSDNDISSTNNFTDDFLVNSENLATEVNSLLDPSLNQLATSREQLARIWYKNTSKTDRDYDAATMYIADELIEYVGFKSIEETDDNGVKQNVTRCFLFKNTLDNSNNITDSDRFKYIQDSLNGSETKIKCAMTSPGQGYRPPAQSDIYVNMGCWLNPTKSWVDRTSNFIKHKDWIDTCSKFRNSRYGYIPYSGTRNRNERQKAIDEIYKNDNNFVNREIKRIKREREEKERQEKQKALDDLKSNKLFGNLFGFQNEQEGFFSSNNIFQDFTDLGNAFKSAISGRSSRIKSACENKKFRHRGNFWHPHAGSWSTDWQASPRDERIWSGWRHSNGSYIGGSNHLKNNFFNDPIYKGHEVKSERPTDDVHGFFRGKIKNFGNYNRDLIKPNTKQNGGNNNNTFSYSNDTKWQYYSNHLNASFRTNKNYHQKGSCRSDYMRIYRKRYPRFNDEKCNTTDVTLDNKEYLNGNVFLLFEVNAVPSGNNNSVPTNTFTNEGFTQEQELNRFYGRVAFIDPFYNVYLYDSDGNFLEDVFQLYKAHEMKHFLTDYDVNAIQGGGKLFGTLGVPGNRGTEKINIATRNYTVTGPNKSDLANLERAIQVSGISRNIQTNTEGEFEVVKDKIHWGRSEKGDDKNGGPMMSIVNYREWNLINLYGQENQYSGTIIKSTLSFNEGSNREDNKIGRNPEREFFTNEGFSGGNYNKISTYDKTNMNTKNLDLERNLMTNNDIEINKDRNISIKQTDIQMQNANNVILADEGKFMANALSKEAFTALEGFVDEEYNSDLKKGLIDQKDILAGDREKVRVLNTIKDHFNSQMTFEAIVEQTKLDVNSKKQWMYIWGSAILLILTIKFFIMSKKS